MDPRLLQSFQLTERSLHRRRFLRWCALGAGLTAVPLLAACGGDDDDVDVVATDPPVEQDTPEAPAAGETAAAEAPTATEPPPVAEASPTVDESPGDEETPEAPDAAVGGETQMFWGTGSPVTMNPLFTTAGNSQQVQRLIFGALVKMNNVPEPIPDMAQTIEISEDATMYTFILHENVTFSDGQPLTSDDVRFTFERALDSRTGSRWRGRLIGIAGAEEYSEDPSGNVQGIETPDDRTIQITLDPPDATFLIILSDFSGLGILPKHVLENVAPEDLDTHEFSLTPSIGAGAFRYARFETDQFLELERNDTYWGEPPPLDRIFLRILQEDVALALLETGEIDLARVPIGEVERVERIPDVTVTDVPSPSVSFITINGEREYLQDKRVRHAMAHAINRQGIVDSIFQGRAEVVNSPILYGPEWMGEPTVELNEYEYDPDRARELLEEAGWDSNQVVVISTFTTVDQLTSAYLAIIQQQFREVGIQTEIQARASTEPLLQNPRDYDLWPIGGGVFRVHPNVSSSYFHTVNDNYARYSNPEVDALYEQAKATADLDEAKELYERIALILNDDLPWIFLWSPLTHHAVRSRLIGFVPPSYAQNELWNAETWTVSDS